MAEKHFQLEYLFFLPHQLKDGWGSRQPKEIPISKDIFIQLKSLQCQAQEKVQTTKVSYWCPLWLLSNNPRQKVAKLQAHTNRKESYPQVNIVNFLPGATQVTQVKVAVSAAAVGDHSTVTDAADAAPRLRLFLLERGLGE